MGLLCAESISDDELDEKKIYCGDASDFENPAEVDYLSIVKATSEYKKLKKDKIESGSAQYFILMSEAGERAVEMIEEVAEEEEYDLVAAKGYLAKLKKPISAKDISKEVLEHLEEAEEE